MAVSLKCPGLEKCLRIGKKKREAKPNVNVFDEKFFFS